MKRLSVSIEVCPVGEKPEILERDFYYILYLDEDVQFKLFRQDEGEKLPYLMYDGSAPSTPEAISSMSQYAKRTLMAEVMQYMTTDIET